MNETSLCIAPGTIIAETYEVIRHIASGGMGQVYEARHLRLADRLVAIKVLAAAAALANDELLARFQREVRICARLVHPHIISVTDFGSLPDGAPYLVMELLHGESLGARLERGKLSLPLALDIISQIASALEAAHADNVVHRDLKPSNIFLLPLSASAPDAVHVKVLDFGIAKILANTTLQTVSTRVMGTPQYMAPEQARGLVAQIGPATDQFALSVIAYELLTGQHAFTGDTLESVLFKVVYEEPTPLTELAPDTPVHVVSAIGRGMAKEPGQRFPSLGAFVRAVTGHAGQGFQEDTTQPSRPPPQAVVRGPTPHRVKPALGLVAILLGFAGGLWLWQARPRSPAPVSARPHAQATLTPTKTIRSAPAPELSSQPQDIPATLTMKAKADTPETKSLRASATAPAAVTETPETAALLDEAERALAAGDYREALRLAKRAGGDVPRARRLKALSYCGLKDRELAPQAVARVAPTDRGNVRAECRRLGLEL